MYFRHSQDGAVWTEGFNLGYGQWPSVTQASDGQGWILWESEGSLLLRHYTGGAWAEVETVLEGGSLSKAYNSNLKVGVSGEQLEWVFTCCPGSPFRLVVDGRPVTPGPTPTLPANVQASDGAYSDRVRITWAPSSGAASYEVYRADSPEDAKTLLGSAVGAWYDDITAAAGTLYSYWVKACNDSGCSGYSSRDDGWRPVSIYLPIVLNQMR